MGWMCADIPDNAAQRRQIGQIVMCPVNRLGTMSTRRRTAVRSADTGAGARVRSAARRTRPAVAPGSPPGPVPVCLSSAARRRPARRRRRNVQDAASSLTPSRVLMAVGIRPSVERPRGFGGGRSRRPAPPEPRALRVSRFSVDDQVEERRGTTGRAGRRGLHRRPMGTIRTAPRSVRTISPGRRSWVMLNTPSVACPLRGRGLCSIRSGSGPTAARSLRTRAGPAPSSAQGSPAARGRIACRRPPIHFLSPPRPHRHRPPARALRPHTRCPITDLGGLGRVRGRRVPGSPTRTRSRVTGGPAAGKASTTRRSRVPSSVVARLDVARPDAAGPDRRRSCRRPGGPLSPQVHQQETSGHRPTVPSGTLIGRPRQPGAPSGFIALDIATRSCAEYRC